MNAEIVRHVLAGGRGPARDVVLLNAGAALFVAGRVSRLADGLAAAAAAIDSGAARRTLDALVRWSATPPATRRGARDVTPGDRALPGGLLEAIAASVRTTVASRRARRADRDAGARCGAEAARRRALP